MSDSVEQGQRRAVTVARIGPSRIAQTATGALLIALAAALLWTFPIGRWGLICLAAALGLWQWRTERAWLIALPVVIASLDLGAWSGRLLFSEQDAVLAVLVGAALVAGQYEGTSRQLLQLRFAPIWLIALAVAIGALRGLQPPLELNANAWNGYLTSWNALRIAKGPLWALALWPLLSHQLSKDRVATEKTMAVGMAAALVCLGTHILWERGLAADLVQAESVRGLFATWMDLSGSYRITGPFSQLHLGGEAIDGFLVITLPFACFLLVQARRPLVSFLAVLAIGAAAYGVLVTFTRTTYAASAIALLTFGAAAVSGLPPAFRLRLLLGAVFAACAALVFIHSFQLGGTFTTLGYLCIVLVATATGYFMGGRVAGAALAAGLVSTVVVGVLLSVHGMTASKWSVTAAPVAIATALTSALFLASGGFFVGRAVRPFMSIRALVAVLSALAVLLPVSTLSFSGAQIQQRFALVSRDLDMREQHWREVMDLIPADLATVSLGTGLGRLPRTFLFGAKSPTGTWHFEKDDSRRFVRLLGTASLCFGQRTLRLEPGVYRVELGLRNPSTQEANVAVKFQPRRLLESESWQPATEQLNFVLDRGASSWKQVRGELHLNASSLPSWYDPRFAVLALSNEGDPRSAVDVEYVRLVDPSGRDRLDNGDFAAGGDRWFAYNDFQHLNWHAKNFYLALFFDMGALGLVVFLFACLAGLLVSWRKAQRAQTFGAATAAAIVGFLTVGTTGTLLDVPQVMTLFLLILIAGMCGTSEAPNRS